MMTSDFGGKLLKPLNNRQSVGKHKTKKIGLFSSRGAPHFHTEGVLKTSSYKLKNLYAKGAKNLPQSAPFPNRDTTCPQFPQIFLISLLSLFPSTEII